MDQKNWYYLECRFRALSSIIGEAFTLDITPNEVAMLYIMINSDSFDKLMISVKDQDDFSSPLCWVLMQGEGIKQYGVLSESSSLNEDVLKIYNLLSLFINSPDDLYSIGDYGKEQNR